MFGAPNQNYYEAEQWFNTVHPDWPKYLRKLVNKFRLIGSVYNAVKLGQPSFDEDKMWISCMNF